MGIELFGSVFEDYLLPTYLILLAVYWGGQFIWWVSYWIRDAWHSLDDDKKVWPVGRIVDKEVFAYLSIGVGSTIAGFICMALWFIILPAAIIAITLLLLRRVIRWTKLQKK